ncbi:hypothetical protein HGM15179_021035 [Zosterops borbonicus]|uniref:Uncharacterized protein n=1 Tax=Zosterops borbonicus TaxID=364589 RepID=A0A8K1D6N3_9PASS|nr:hypothetical protein HGM15179_021035 [Zosterops borbonicus]
MDQYGPVWTSINQYGPVWTSINQYGPVWTSTNQYSNSKPNDDPNMDPIDPKPKNGRFLVPLTPNLIGLTPNPTMTPKRHH